MSIGENSNINIGENISEKISNTALRALAERGLIKQCSDLEALDRRMNEGPITFYIGVDPTGASLHVGHTVPIFAAAHLARAGHRAIIVLGGGTARIGDPSGKTEMRQMINIDGINKNVERVRAQLVSFLERAGAEAIFMNNADWLATLNYIDFLRDIGRHFSVNRMLSFEAYRSRMERGLSFIEFNYQLLQSYDFLELYRREGCELQIGGDDQWGNIVSGVELIRRVEGPQARSFGLTLPLVLTSDGQKMGKTEKGAVFLDAELTPPFDFFQYWRNIADSDLLSFLRFFTFLSIEEIDEMASWEDERINKAKERLAYEATSVVHGWETAEKVRESVRAAFGKGQASGQPRGQASDSMPTVNVLASELAEGIGLLELFVRSGLCASRSEARRLVQQGGASLNGERMDEVERVLSAEDLAPDGAVLRAGKKRYVRVVLG